MKEYGFQFAVLRYTHDPVTREFINIGLVLYSTEARYFKARMQRSFDRISQAFPGAKAAGLTQTLDHLESEVATKEKRLWAYPSFWKCPQQLRCLLEFILPSDDSCLLFGGYGGGLACDLDHELDRLFDRMVMRYVRPRCETT